LALSHCHTKGSEQQSKEDGTSINQFVATAVAESSLLCKRRSTLPAAKAAATSRAFGQADVVPERRATCADD
jgi:hypothetical protein